MTAPDQVTRQFRDAADDAQQVAANKKNNPATADEAKALLYELSSALIRRGLHVTVGRDATVEARQPDVAGTTVTGRALSPGLRQTLAIHIHEDVLWWHWEWSGPTRDASAELEPLCPGAEVDKAAERITAVLAVEPAAG